MTERRAVRAILLTPEARILLSKVEEPASRCQVWIAPGGAVEDGESVEAGLRRELAEETGLCGEVGVGPMLWTRFHEFDWDGRRVSQHEEFYLVATAPFEPTMAHNPSKDERTSFREFRWWTADEMRNAPDLFAPKRLADLLDMLVKTGPPETPFDAGI